MSRSQAPLCLYTLWTISIRLEGTFERLRYILGGDHPSQTTHQTLSSARIYGTELDFQTSKGSISLFGSVEASASTSKPPTYSAHANPKINVKL